MSKKFPIDEFDSVTAQGGRHRVRRTGKTRAVEFFRVAIVALVVAGVGFFGLKLIDSANLFAAAPAPVETVSAQDIAQGLEIGVIDATNVAGTADKVAKSLVDSGYNVTSATELSAGTSHSTVKNTIIYYFDTANKAAAKVIAAALGAYPVQQSTAYAGAITVVIGADYK
jgi:LytR cell envelope-related transcriptional attenuator